MYHHRHCVYAVVSAVTQNKYALNGIARQDVSYDSRRLVQNLETRAKRTN